MSKNEDKSEVVVYLRAKCKALKAESKLKSKSLENVVFTASSLLNSIDQIAFENKVCPICDARWDSYYPIHMIPHDKDCSIKKLRDAIEEEDKEAYND